MLSIAAPSRAAELSNADKQFLANYEKVHAALVADDLTAAKKAAGDLGESGAVVAKSETLEGARAGFSTLSDQAVKAAGDQSGYYVLHCPMLKKDWVQTSKQVANPYGGKEMLTCGAVKS